MIYFGFDEVVYGWQRYFDLCNSFELRNADKPEDEPSIATLNRWRVDSPRGFAWLVHLDPRVNELILGAFDRGSNALPAGIDAAIEATLERTRALAAKALVLETPPELPPSDVSRELIRRLGARLAEASKLPVLWEASGLWTFEDGSAVAAEAGVTYVVDPFMLEADNESLGRSSVAAFRVTERAAARRQFDAWEMENLLGWASTHERTFVLLAGRYKIPHAKELALRMKSDAN